MKPVLNAITKKNGELTRYELTIAIADGRQAVCQVFPLVGELKYRYLVREKDGKTETEYFSRHTHPAMLELWDQLPEAEKPERPKRFNETDLRYYLEQLSGYRQVFLKAVWVPVPGQEIPTAPTPEGVQVYDPTQPHGGIAKAAYGEDSQDDSDGDDDE